MTKTSQRALLAIAFLRARGGGPVGDKIFPVRMEIDYVRVYQRRP